MKEYGYGNFNNKGKKGKVSKESAISKEQLNKLLDETEGKDQVIIALLGFGGMREGELIHMRPNWIHINDSKAEVYGRNHIKIPSKGVNCTCNNCMLQEYINTTLKDDETYDKELFLKKQKKFYELKESGKLDKLNLHAVWKPKSKSGARRIPFINKQTEKIVSKYFSEHESIEMTRIQVWDRVKRITTKVLGEPLYPHVLRASIATVFGDMGMSAPSLKGIMGWANLSTADAYIGSSDKQIMKEINNMKF